MVSTGIIYRIQAASLHDIETHLNKANKDFIPPLDQKTNIGEYAVKILNNAVTIEAWNDSELVGLIAVYCNNHETGNAFITNVSVIKEYSGRGISSELMKNCITYVKNDKFMSIALEVNEKNFPAINLYKKFNFILTGKEKFSHYYQLKLTS